MSENKAKDYGNGKEWDYPIRGNNSKECTRKWGIFKSVANTQFWSALVKPYKYECKK